MYGPHIKQWLNMVEYMTMQGCCSIHTLPASAVPMVESSTVKYKIITISIISTCDFSYLKQISNNIYIFVYGFNMFKIIQIS